MSSAFSVPLFALLCNPKKSVHSILRCLKFCMRRKTFVVLLVGLMEKCCLVLFFAIGKVEMCFVPTTNFCRTKPNYDGTGLKTIRFQMNTCCVFLSFLLCFFSPHLIHLMYVFNLQNLLFKKGERRDCHVSMTP